MMTTINLLKSIGLNESHVDDFVSGPQTLVGNFDLDSISASSYWAKSLDLLTSMPAKSKRTTEESMAVKLIFDQARAHREEYLRIHASTLYDKLTQNRTRFLRLDELLEQSHKLVPGLTPSAETLHQERELIQSQKDGHEIDQGLFLSHVLAHQSSGLHLCHAMLLEHPKTSEHREQFMKDGRLDLEGVSLHRQDNATHLIFQNGKYLNAEDDMTLANTEVAADLAILDPNSNIAVMRGSEIDEGKYKGKRTFCSGINLTRLYNGKIPYLWYIERDMGIVNKINRGLATPEHSANEILGQTKEKLWIAVVDQFAIGGGCQYLLVTDINIAGDNAYLTLPARKEGIIPGVANMRLPRFVGDRIARQAIMMERRIECNSDVGRMICDEVVPSENIEDTLSQTIERVTSSGVVSASGNRKAFRVSQEPLDLFRQYMSVYAKEQAYCHFSPALISNLEKNWDARNRKLKA
jgi:(3,5-dihydroxyphenyl)acetyl-CoA 1,2-dioxygenase